MRLQCRHGFFEFYPQKSTDLKRFERIQNAKLVSFKNFFTFYYLSSLPRHSLKGSPFGNLLATQTYEGRDASEVMRENDFVFHLASGLLIFKDLVQSITTLPPTQDCAIAKSCWLQPGSVLQNGKRIISYEGEIDLDTQRLYVYSMEFSL